MITAKQARRQSKYAKFPERLQHILDVIDTQSGLGFEFCKFYQGEKIGEMDHADKSELEELKFIVLFKRDEKGFYYEIIW